MRQSVELLYLETVNLALLARTPGQRCALVKAAEAYRQLLISNVTAPQ